ncbi:MAG TPA: hypothetical protein VGE85_11525 [Terracidiphilus sp.]
MKKPLETSPSRRDLSDRECSTIIGAVIGGLTQLADIDDIRNAVRWWAENDGAWAQLKAVQALCNKDAAAMSAGVN